MIYMMNMDSILLMIVAFSWTVALAVPLIFFKRNAKKIPIYSTIMVVAGVISAIIAFPLSALLSDALRGDGFLEGILDPFIASGSIFFVAVAGLASLLGVTTGDKNNFALYNIVFAVIFLTLTVLTSGFLLFALIHIGVAYFAGYIAHKERANDKYKTPVALTVVTQGHIPVLCPMSRDQTIVDGMPVYDENIIVKKHFTVDVQHDRLG